MSVKQVFEAAPRFTYHVSRFTRSGSGLFSILFVVLIMGIAGTAHAQYASSCGRSWSPSQVPGTGFLEVVPSLCVSERYDSNVFYRPPTPGLQRDDFVTNVTTVFRVNFNGRYASGVLNAGGFGEAYINNPNLNYLGTVNSLILNLDNTIKRWLPNASLRIVEAVSYTPLPPGFSNPTPGTSPDDPGNIQDVYAQGILLRRTNNLRNSGTVSASYATTAVTSLNASYSYSLLRFGSSPSAEGVDPNLTQTSQNLFDTTSQTGAVGGTARLSELDTMNIRYAHTQFEFTGGATTNFFKSDTATMGWSRKLTPNFRTELGGGGILISPGLTTYTANAALIMNFQNNSATISYLHSAFPSYVDTGEPLIGDRFSLSAIQMIDRKWQLSETANYMRTTGGAGIERNTYFASVGLNYWITGIWSTSLNYQYMNNSYSQSGSSSDNFDRHAIMFSVNTSWE